MQQRVILQVPIDKELKKKAESISTDLGFSSLQEVIRVMVTKLSKKELTVRVIESEEPSKSLIRAMKRARENRKAGKASPIFDKIEEDLAWLKKQGI